MFKEYTSNLHGDILDECYSYLFGVDVGSTLL